MRCIYVFLLLLIAINSIAGGDAPSAELSHLHEAHIHSHDQHSTSGEAAGHHHCCHAHGHHYLAEHTSVVHSIKSIASQPLPLDTSFNSQRSQPPTPPPKHYS